MSPPPGLLPVPNKPVSRAAPPRATRRLLRGMGVTTHPGRVVPSVANARGAVVTPNAAQRWPEPALHVHDHDGGEVRARGALATCGVDLVVAASLQARLIWPVAGR